MDYLKRQQILQPVRRERVVEHVVEKQTETKPTPPIDIKALANALAQVMTTMPSAPLVNGQIAVTEENTFDNSKTLERLADTMTVQKGKSESNFDNLGNEHQTKANKEEIDKTIDLLSNLNDLND